MDGAQLRSDLEALGKHLKACLEKDLKTRAQCPPRQLSFAKSPYGVFGTMGALSEELELFISKTAAFVQQNVSDAPSVNVELLCFDSNTGQPKKKLDGVFVTNLKSAAAAKVATELYGPKKLGSVSVLGAGVMAKWVSYAMLSIASVKELVLYNQTETKGRALVEHLSALFPEKKIHFNGSLQGSLERAEVVCCCTSSSEALFSLNDFPNIKHLNLMGAHTERDRELSHQDISQCNIIVEDVETAVIEAGKVHEAAIEMGMKLKNQEQRSVFSSTGHAFYDLVTSHYLLNKEKTNELQATDL